MSTTNTRLLSSTSVKSIMNKRKNIASSAVGGPKQNLTVDGNGNVIDVVDKDGNLVSSSIPGYEGTVLQKKIFNLKAASQLAMSNARTRGYFVEGLKVERAGDKQKAHEFFRQYLNATQISFGILLPSATADMLANGVDIAAKIQLVTTENGSLLTIDTSTINVVAAVDSGEVSFNMDEFEAEVATTTTTAAKAPHVSHQA